MTLHGMSKVVIIQNGYILHYFILIIWSIYHYHGNILFVNIFRIIIYYININFFYIFHS